MAAILHLITLVTKLAGEAHKNEFGFSYSLPPESENL